MFSKDVYRSELFDSEVRKYECRVSAFSVELVERFLLISCDVVRDFFDSAQEELILRLITKTA